MTTKHALSIVAALGLAAAAYAQAPATPEQNGAQPGAQSSQSSDNAAQSRDAGPQPSQGTTSPSSASSPSQRDVTSSQGTPEASTNASPDPAAAASPHQDSVTHVAAANSAGALTAGMMVEDSSGQTLGSVGDVLPGKSGDRGYVVITGSDGSSTPVPYRVASAMAKDGKIVLDHSVYDGAPKVQQSELQNGKSWQKKTDRYWKKHAG